MPETLLIVWHSRTGAAQQLAQAAEQGAAMAVRELDAHERVKVVVRKASETTESDLLNAQAYLFCAPENLGSRTGEMTEFLDRNYYAVLDQLHGRPYGVVISAGSDGSGAAKQVERICTGWRLRSISPPCIVNTDAQSPEAILAAKHMTDTQREPAWNMGGTLAALLA